jgi:hypothetical protein
MQLTNGAVRTELSLSWSTPQRAQAPKGLPWTRLALLLEGDQPEAQDEGALKAELNS